jgi:hypothetical protein
MRRFLIVRGNRGVVAAQAELNDEKSFDDIYEQLARAQFEGTTSREDVELALLPLVDVRRDVKERKLIYSSPLDKKDKLEGYIMDSGKKGKYDIENLFLPDYKNSKKKYLD